MSSYSVEPTVKPNMNILVFKTNFFYDNELSENENHIDMIEYVNNILTDMVETELSEHSEMNEYTYRYARAIFKYDKFNGISSTKTEWISGEDDMTSIAKNCVEILTDNILYDFDVQFEAVNEEDSFDTILDYVDEEYIDCWNLSLKHVLEKALQWGEIIIYLKCMKKNILP